MKRVLFLAPQPFFQERGTPIAVKLAASVIANKGRRDIDLLVYPEGDNILMEGVTIHRIWTPKYLRGVRPGISWKKLLSDFLFAVEAFRLVWRARKNQYALVHAVEESVFIACVLKWTFGIPFIYDMDSSLVLQLTEKWKLLRPLLPLFHWMERLAIKQSIAVVPVCDALAVIAEAHGSKNTATLYDVSLLGVEGEGETSFSEDIRNTCCLPPHAKVVMYIGNLEPYQGIDLLLESFATVAHECDDATIVLIGGIEEHISMYQKKAADLKINHKTFLIGARPVSALHHYLKQATILVSPRIAGNNTPMKVYSYIHSGVPLLATDLPTHTQVLNSEIAKLAPAHPSSFGKALCELLRSEPLRKELASKAFILAEERYTFKQFEKTLHNLYDSLSKDCPHAPAS